MNQFREQQRSVVFGMSIGIVLTVLGLALPVIWDRFPSAPTTVDERALLWIAAESAITIWLVLAVARLAHQRLLDERDIDAGGGLGSTRAKALQAQLQNTLEQTLIAAIAHGAWLALAPPKLGLVALLFAGYFHVGRALFVLGYSGGAPRRALGFALTFFPSVSLLLCSAPWAWARIGSALQ